MTIGPRRHAEAGGQHPDALQLPLQHVTALSSSCAAVVDAASMQLLSQVVLPLQPSRQVTRLPQAGSFAHVWVYAQQLALTHDAHAVVGKVMPQAVVCAWQTLEVAHTP
jgi:hypothetical protein